MVPKETCVSVSERLQLASCLWGRPHASLPSLALAMCTRTGFGGSVVLEQLFDCVSGPLAEAGSWLAVPLSKCVGLSHEAWEGSSMCVSSKARLPSWDRAGGEQGPPPWVLGGSRVLQRTQDPTVCR